MKFCTFAAMTIAALGLAACSKSQENTTSTEVVANDAGSLNLSDTISDTSENSAGNSL